LEVRQYIWYQKTRLSGLSCRVVGMILLVGLAILVELRLMTDGHRQTDRHKVRAYTAARRAVKMAWTIGRVKWPKLA